MFSEFTYENCKFLTDAGFPTAPLTIQVGDNALGIVSCNEGIKLLSEIANGVDIHDAVQKIPGFEIKHMHSNNPAATNNKELNLGCSYISDSKEHFHYNVTLQITPEIMITNETVTIESLPTGQITRLWKSAYFTDEEIPGIKKDKDWDYQIVLNNANFKNKSFFSQSNDPKWRQILNLSDSYLQFYTAMQQMEKLIDQQTKEVQV